MQSNTVTQPAIEKHFSIEKKAETLVVTTSAVFAEELAASIKAAIQQHSPTRIEISFNPRCWIGLDHIGQAAVILHKWKRADPAHEVVLKDMPSCGIEALKMAHLIGAFQVNPPTKQESQKPLVMPKADNPGQNLHHSHCGNDFSIEFNELGLKVVFNQINGELEDILGPFRLIPKGRMFSQITLDLRACNPLLSEQIHALPLYGTRLTDHGSILLLCAPSSPVPDTIASLIPRMREMFHITS